RNGAKQHAGQERDGEREQQHGAVDRNLIEPRQVGGRQAISRRTPPYARPSPSTPPSTPRAMLSTSSSRAICALLAPSAARIASSCWRPSARTNRRLATFAQAISRTIPIVPISTQRTVLTSPM